jgi:hypothetical protein
MTGAPSWSVATGCETRLGAQGFDHAVGQRHSRHQFGRTFGWDVDNEVGPVRVPQGRVRIVIGVVIAPEATQLHERVRAPLRARRPGLSLGGAHPVDHLVQHVLDQGAVDVGQLGA